MNQIAFASVLLRLIGVYIIYDLIAGVSFGMTFQFMGWIGILVMAVLAACLIVYGTAISRMFFAEGENVITAGRISERGLVSAGLSLLGVYFLISYLPWLVDASVNLFKTEAIGADADSTPMDPFIMTILSIGLIMNARRIGDWIVQRDNKQKSNKPEVGNGGNVSGE